MANQLNLNTLSLEELKAKVAALPTTLDTSDATATASDMLEGETAYVNSQKVTGNIPTKTASNLTASGATVTVPAGYYASQATKSVTTATQATPSVSIDANGKITATSTQSAGYVSAGTKTGMKQLTTQAAKTITPTKSTQTAVAKNVYTTGEVTVAPIPDQYTDVSEVTAQEQYVRQGDIFVDANGDKKTGKLRFSVALGMNGAGFPDTYQVESRYDINSNPNNPEFYYLSLLDQDFGTATPNHVLEDYTFSTNQYRSSAQTGYHFGKAISGTMPNNGDTSQTIDGLETKSVTIPEGYTTGGTVTVDDTVDNIADTQANLLEQIQNAIQGKSVPGGGSSSGNIETCTVTITRSGSLHIGTQYERFLGDVYYTTIENNAVVAKCENVGTGKTITCICNSLIAIDEDSARVYHTYSGMTEILSSDGNSFAFGEYNIKMFFITASSNENATLDVEMD